VALGSGDNGHDLIVIGASVGGVDALRRILPRLPADLPAAVCIVVHLSPTHVTHLDEVLQARCALPVTLARNMAPLDRGCVYLAPPDHHLLIGEDHVRVMRGPKENGHRPAVDPLFRTAAHVYGRRVVGVILTGSLDCGAAGLAIIKMAGGIAIVQDPADAEYADMPLNAIHATQPDHIAPIERIPELLVAATRQPPAAVPPSPRADTGWCGAPSGISCPACAGSLWSESDAGVERLRCRVGHIYSLDGLFLSHGDALETALWAAARALEEHAILAHRLAQRARDNGNDRLADGYRRKEGQAEQQAAAIRDAVERLPHTPEPS